MKRCLIFVSLNVLTTIREYFENETIEALAEVSAKKVYLPDIAVCSQKKFKDPKRIMLTLDEYKENTYDPGPVELIGIGIVDLIWTEEYLYTYTYGLCILFNFPTPVSETKFD